MTEAMRIRKMSKALKKRLVAVIFRPLVSVLYIKVLGKHPFINRYTKRLPILRKVISVFDSKTISNKIAGERERDYKRWFLKNNPTADLLNTQRKKQNQFQKQPLISILVPTYNTNPRHLEECIDSVLNQSYEKWELCIADDASDDEEVRSIIERYAERDKRIKFVYRKENGHICKASNSALKLASGEYIALLDHDDILWPNALYEVVSLINNHPGAMFIYSDEDKIDESGEKHLDPFFKPDWSYDFLRSINYITHFAILDKGLVHKVGGFRPGYEGAQDWDLFLRASRAVNYVYHVPKVLYSWRKSINSTAQQPSAKDYAYINQKKALEDDVQKRGLKAKISWQIPLSMWRVDYSLKKKPLVSIIIPTKDQFSMISQCLSSIKERTEYAQFEIVIVDTGSTDEKVWGLYEDYRRTNPNVQILRWKEKPFNFSSACNYGAEHAKGEFYLFLNNDTEVISPAWIEDMLAYSHLEGVGAVGCKLYYPDKKIQHAGIILGVGGQNGTPGIAGHFFPAFIDRPPQDPIQDLYIGGTRNFTAVTAACIMVSKEKFSLVKGFDPKFRIAFNDVDFCLKLYDLGLRNVYLPHVELVHHESISIGKPGSKVRDLGEFAKEINMMMDKWGALIKDDPFYHPEFRRDVASARLKV